MRKWLFSKLSDLFSNIDIRIVLILFFIAVSTGHVGRLFADREAQGQEFLGYVLAFAVDIALAISLSGILQVLCLFIFWNRYSHNSDGNRVYGVYIKMALLSVLIGIILFGFKAAVLPDPATQSGIASLFVMLVVGVLFFALLAGLAYGFKIHEVRDPLERVVARIKGKAQSA